MPVCQLCNTVAVLNTLELYAKEIDELLLDGETPLSCISADYFSGREILSTPSTGDGSVVNLESVKTETERGWEINPFDGSLSVHAWDAGVEKLISGTTLIGAPGSLAVTLSAVITPTADVLLTNQRLMLVCDLRDSGRATSLVWVMQRPGHRRDAPDPARSSATGTNRHRVP